MKNTVAETQKTHRELLQALATVPEDKLNTIPYAGSWTAAQVIEHITKAVGVAVLYAETQPSDRDPEEKIGPVSDLFLNLDIKMQSPDFIYPSDKQYTKDELQAMIEDKFTKLEEAAKTLDLTPICLAAEVPGFGAFTRQEYAWFFLVHSQRHTFQLKKIAKALAA